MVAAAATNGYINDSRVSNPTQSVDPMSPPVARPAVRSAPLSRVRAAERPAAGDDAARDAAAALGKTVGAATDPVAGPRRGPRWERRKESRPSELLDAALEVFVERGFALARLEDVAARAGVSKGTLYLYFDNKEELFKAVVRKSILPLIDEFRSSVAASERSSSELLGEYLHGWWTAYGGTRLSGVAKLCIAESGNFPEVARFWRDEVIGANNALVAAILQRGIDDGEFRPIDIDPMVHLIMAPLVLKMLMRDSFDACCSTSSIDPQRFIGHHLDMLLRALARNP
jgi:AcrR family transcriptional regulator